MDLLNPAAQERRGMLYGLAAVAAFSLTLPATRVAVGEFDVATVALGRIVLASVLAACALIALRAARPAPSQLGALALVGAGVVFGFPLLTSWAMSRVDASHGAVLIGLLPLATALAGVWRSRERPSAAFWAASTFGTALVLAFALHAGAGAPQSADAALLAAVVCAAIGYAEGGRLARELGGWQTIAWALVLCAPVALPLLVLSVASARAGLQEVSAAAWIGFAYLGVVSQFLGFVLWYKGLSLGGVARVSQVQLLQLFLTLGFSWALLGEQISAATAGFSAAVVAMVWIGRKAPIARPT